MKQKEVSKYKLLRDHSVVIDLLTITTFWCFTVAFVNPYGDFPLNDDWVYSTSVKRMLEEGVFRPIEWTSMTLISQTLWGTLFSSLFGFSFTVLRFSTLFLALIGILGFYLLLKQLGGSRSFVATAVLVFAFNPIYFALSHTFMTDVPFTTFTVLALLFFFRSIVLESDIQLFAGTCFAVAAILCRQLGLFLPIIFCLIFLIKYGFSMRWLLRASLPILLGFGAFIGFESWMEASNTLTGEYSSKMTIMLSTLQNPELLFIRFVNHTFVVLLYLGLFLFPFLILLPRPISGLKKWQVKCANAILYLFIILSLLVLVFQKRMMPLTGNIIAEAGIGPVTLKDVLVLELPHWSALSSEFWLLVTAISILGGGLILTYTTMIIMDFFSDIKSLRENNTKIASLFFILGIAVYFLPIATVDKFFDRYFLPLIPLLCAAIAPLIGHAGLSRRYSTILVAILSFAILAVFSIAGTRDYLTWNKIRWEALRSLVVENRIEPSKIDGGFEFNGWYLYRADYRVEESKSWWWVDDDLYIVTMGEIKGYEVVRRYSFSRWFPPGRGNILVLRREKSKNGNVNENLTNNQY